MKPINISNITTNHIDVSVLPENMQVLISIIGLSDALVLAEAYGGEILRPPKNAPVGNKIELLIGREKFVKLCQEIGGDKFFYVPKLDKVIAQIKSHLAKDMNTKGYSATEICRELNISHRHAQRIKQSDTQTPPPNLDLFR